MVKSLGTLGWGIMPFSDSCPCPCAQNCDQVVEAIKGTGQVKREQRDLEEQVRIPIMSLLLHFITSLWHHQIETESAKKVGANLERILADFEQMKKENQQLSAQLKAHSWTVVYWNKFNDWLKVYHVRQKSNLFLVTKLTTVPILRHNPHPLPD